MPGWGLNAWGLAQWSNNTASSITLLENPSITEAVQAADYPLIQRSLFTDKGPIAKPPLTLLAGTAGVLEGLTQLFLPSPGFGGDPTTFIGQYLTFSGGVKNGGTFRITSAQLVYDPVTHAVTGIRVKVQASFTLPDAGSGSLVWEIFDPRDGQIADSPSDVVVRINGFPVVPQQVIGLLGQIVMPTTPAPTDDVRVDYSWVCNPTVEVRRLNSREFRLNAWNRDRGYLVDNYGHKYRYNNVLITPSEYEPDDIDAILDQPLLREMHYRAYERAYTPVFNDPSLLLLNSPIHKIAFPPAERTVSEEFVAYEANVLPESDTPAWVRKGTGTASVSAGVLTIQDTSSGPFPNGRPIFWTQNIDLTFPHAFAMTWRFSISATPVTEGVFTGVAAGYSDEEIAVVVGFLEIGGVKHIGILRRGATSPEDVTSWIGGIDPVTGGETSAPVPHDWGIVRSYRIFRDTVGTVKVYVDGNVVETLRATPGELPFLEELNAPFDELQGAFFGSISRPSQNTSEWSFVRYLILPTNPIQASPSSFVSYEANAVPEVGLKPWTPIGYHGTETILASDYLLLDSTSATDAATESDVGLIGGDFRGFVRIEPLLQVSSQVVLDVGVQLRTQTHGIAPNALMTAVDDGDRLIQLAIFPDRATPKISYGGRSLPEDFSPYHWTPTVTGTATAVMVGRTLRITNSIIGNGLVYAYDDTMPVVSDDRVFAAGIDYIFEFRCRVDSFITDGAGFAGAFTQVFDGTRLIGVMFEKILGVPYVTFHSDGVPILLGRFAFDWTTITHTYRVRRSVSGDLVSLFIDGIFIGSLAYSSFASELNPVGQISFGSATLMSAGALSVVEWDYCNAWRVRNDLRHYVGLWKGFEPNSLIGYHLPLKTSGKGAPVAGNALEDTLADFIAAGVLAGDKLIVDYGSNQGVYEVGANPVDPTHLTIVGSFPLVPSLVDYRIARETDWTYQRKLRIARDPSGDVTILLDTDPVPIIQVGYNTIDLPSSSAGLVRTLSGGLPAIVFGSFDPTNLEQSSWDFVRYGIIKSVTEQLIAPHHQFLNQRNVIASPEHLFTSIPHSHTDYESSSTGIPPKQDPDFLANPNLTAFTRLNEGTPLVPSTQSFEVRRPYPIQIFASALNRPEDVLNNDGNFTLNDGSFQYRLIVPKDVLYSSLDVIEQRTGDVDLLTPFTDEGQPTITGIQYQKTICLDYTADTLPENDPTTPTPWSLMSDNPSEVNTSVFGGILTYGTSPTGTRTAYRNNTPLPDSPGLQTEARFRLKLANDGTLGTGDTQVRFGLSAPGMTIALAFVTSPTAERLILVLDLNNGNVLGSASFDFLDGNFHTYHIVRNPGMGVVQVSVDP
jgi:hypothetical protein